jgi:hypothetical protein
MKKTVHTGPAERPILFQTDMVKAILEGRKTQTRRTRGLDSINGDPNFWNRKGDPRKNTVRLWDSTKENNPNPLAISFGFKDPIDSITYIKSKFGKPGDLLWVRETFGSLHGEPLYKANYSDKTDERIAKSMCLNGWKPSIHMPKEASRIWLMIEDIRVERVQEISEEDAIAEGIKNVNLYGKEHWVRYDEGFCTEYPTISFRSLWISINGEESWNANPWVWVIQFRVLSTTGKPSDEQIQQNLSAFAALREKKEEVVNG